MKERDILLTVNMSNNNKKKKKVNIVNFVAHEESPLDPLKNP